MDRFSKKYQKIWNIIREIPYGKVATYGQIARLAGLGEHARMVGYALHSAPDSLEIPWHRVINARGEISLPKEDGRYDLQKALLEKEGVTFVNGKINLKKYGWNPIRVKKRL
ncbi:MAG: methylated-DNA--[protein]-cysteine S-methyltransferase [Calditrichae bacterium]|nr:methylated-DNA--[protein]-cysteine S-methyltransferase [Calditrichia bacterium]